MTAGEKKRDLDPRWRDAFRKFEPSTDRGDVKGLMGLRYLGEWQEAADVACMSQAGAEL